jgi:hypothetical protein
MADIVMWQLIMRRFDIVRRNQSFSEKLKTVDC